MSACECVWYPCTFGLTTNCPGRHFPHKTTPKRVHTKPRSTRFLYADTTPFPRATYTIRSSPVPVHPPKALSGANFLFTFFSRCTVHDKIHLNHIDARLLCTAYVQNTMQYFWEQIFLRLAGTNHVSVGLRNDYEIFIKRPNRISIWETA